MNKKRQGKLRRFRKHLRREICIFVGVQLTLLLLFAFFFADVLPIPLEKAKTEDVIVEKILLEGSGHKISGRHISLYDVSGKHFQFDRDTGEKGYTENELLEAIHPGDKLTLVYTETTTLFGKTVRLILDARSATEVYRYWEEEASFQTEAVACYVLFGVLELVFLSVVVLYYCFKYKTA